MGSITVDALWLNKQDRGHQWVEFLLDNFHKGQSQSTFPSIKTPLPLFQIVRYSLQYIYIGHIGVIKSWSINKHYLSSIQVETTSLDGRGARLQVLPYHQMTTCSEVDELARVISVQTFIRRRGNSPSIFLYRFHPLICHSKGSIRPRQVRRLYHT